MVFRLKTFLVSARWLRDLPVFAALFAAIGFMVVPARVDNMWYDPDFTGWVAPLARRLAEGQVFYTDGAHFPMPPLSFVLMRLLFGAHAVWLDESLVNFLLQCGMVLLGYAALSRWLPRPLPLIAALSAAGYYFALPKSIVYDALAEFIAAAAIAAASVALQDPDAKRKMPFAIWGACLPALALTKQTTFIGLAAGTVAALGFALAALPPSRRKEILLWFALGLAGGSAVFGALVTPWISWSGFINDAYLSSRELKAPGMREDVFLQYAGRYIFAVGASGLFPLACLYLATRRFSPKKQKAGFDTVAADMPDKLDWLAPIAAGAAIILCLVAPLGRIPGLLHGARTAGTWDFLDGFFIPSAFALVTLLILRALTGKRDELARFGLLCLLALAAALAHNLSQPAQLRLSYDNNTVIMLGIAALLSLFVAALQRLALSRLLPALTLCCFAVVFCGWLPMAGEMQGVRETAESWPEIAWLAGGRMKPSAGALRALTATVAKNSAPADTVLLLPEDPDLESWWNRPRPALDGAIVFTDQYWKRLVSTDLQRLEQAPPKLIVIGPRNAWPGFSALFGGGDAALVAGLRKHLLPSRYRLLKAQPITFQGKPDFMDVWIRRE